MRTLARGLSLNRSPTGVPGLQGDLGFLGSPAERQASNQLGVHTLIERDRLEVVSKRLRSSWEKSIAPQRRPVPSPSPASSPRPPPDMSGCPHMRRR
jgi:hypothetical protein